MKSRHGKIPAKLTEKELNEFVFPSLTIGSRGPKSKISCYKIFNYILYLMHTGCQWYMLPAYFCSCLFYLPAYNAYSTALYISPWLNVPSICSLILVTSILMQRLFQILIWVSFNMMQFGNI